jgi:hypothetical protein
MSAVSPTFWLEVTPAVATLAPGAVQQFSGIGVSSDGSRWGIRAEWRAIGGTIDGSGRYVAPAAAGTSRVILTRVGDALADTAVVTVGGTAPAAPSGSVTLTGVEVTPASVALAPGGSAQLSALGRLSDGGTTPLSVDWSATGGAVSSEGRYTAGGTAGTFRVIAVRRGDPSMADTSVVTVGGGSAPTAPSGSVTLTGLELTPATATVATGASLVLTAIGRLSDGGTTPLSVDWSATGGTIGADGRYTAGGTPGTFRVIAVRRGDPSMADTSVVTISGAAPAPTSPSVTLTGVELTPSTATVPTGGSQRFAAVGRLSNGGTTPLSVSWSATGGTITWDGLYTAGGTAGTYRVIAVRTGDTLADTSVVTVTGGTTAPAPPAPAPAPTGTADIANITFDDPAQFGRLTVPGGPSFPSQTSWHRLDATGGRNGSAAMRVDVANTNYEPLGPQWAARGRVFVRYWFRTSSGFLTASPSQHNVKGPRFHYNGGNLGVLKAEKLSWGFDEEAGGAQAATSMAWGLVPQDDRNAGLVPTCENLADGAWHSIEIDYDRNAGTNVEVRMWCDGRAMVLPPGPAPFVTGITYVGGDRATNTPSTIRAPRTGPAASTDVTIFETVSQGFAGTIWIDDLAVSSQRIGP